MLLSAEHLKSSAKTQRTDTLRSLSTVDAWKINKIKINIEFTKTCIKLKMIFFQFFNF